MAHVRVDDLARRRNARLLAVAGLGVLVGLLAVVFLRDGGSGDDARPTPDTRVSPERGGGSPTSTTGPRSSSTTTTTSSTTTTSLVIPPSTGRFDGATGSGPVRGSGAVHTYRVEVEQGAGVTPDEFASSVDAILSDPRSWTAGGGVAFQRVQSGGSFLITLATPDTADQICLPLHTNGKFSCHEGHHIVINLRRWLEGTVDLPLDVPEYRANVINHEVGHELGHGHVGCPGPGRRAPVMMQQSKGLDGCLANSWPTLDGT